MTIYKIYDACILIRFLEEISCEKLFEEWNKILDYEQYTTTEVLKEIQRNARNRMNRLIANRIIKILDPVPKKELDKIGLLNPNLSTADCSVLYYVLKISDPICLTDEYPLRVLCIENVIEIHGTAGIYSKLKKDGTFSLTDIEKSFKNFKQDPRVFPPT